MSMFSCTRVAQWMSRLAVLLLLAATTGCPSIDHVAKYRDARDLYNTATLAANGTAIDSTWDTMLPPRYSHEDALSGHSVSTGLELNDYEKLTSAYFEAAAIVSRLNQTAVTRSALIADDLYGSSLVLEVLCKWKGSFYYRLLDADIGTEVNDESRPPSAANGSADLPNYSLETSMSMVEVRTVARNALNRIAQSNQRIYPRDRFVLEAIPALSRYDNAYLHAIQLNRKGELVVSSHVATDEVIMIIEDMAKAELHLDQIFGEGVVRDDLNSASVAARYIMLNTAITLLLHTDRPLVVNGEGGSILLDENDDFRGKDKVVDLLPTLVSRREAFIKEAMTEGTYEWEFITNLYPGRNDTPEIYLAPLYDPNDGS